MGKLFHLLLIKSKCYETLITCFFVFNCRFSLNLLLKDTPNGTSLHQCRLLHTTLSRKGLEEFFDDPKNWGEEKVKSGEIFGLIDIKYVIELSIILGLLSSLGITWAFSFSISYGNVYQQKLKEQYNSKLFLSRLAKNLEEEWVEIIH